MSSYSIKDIEHLSGIKAHTLRIWEKRYGIIEPKRTDTNIRYYDDTDLKKILNISFLNRHGIKISNIAELKDSQLTDKIMEFTMEDPDFSDHIESLIISMIDFDKPKFDKIFNKSILTHGLESSITKIIIPFFQKIGVLWQTGNINPAQEHFVSNLVRQKIISAVEDLPLYINNNSKTIVFFLPNNEWHELSLLFYSYIALKRGHNTIYLGSSVPTESLLQLDKELKFDYLVTSISTKLNFEQSTDIINQLSDKYKKQNIILLGSEPVKKLFKPKSNNISITLNIEDFQKVIG